MNRENVPTNDEQVFLDAGDVFVSSTRAVLFGETYAMSNITSVRKSRVRMSLIKAITMLIGSVILAFIAMFAVYALLGQALGMLAGMAVFAFFAYRSCYIHLRYPDCVLHIGTMGGEIDGLTSKDERFVDQVVEALNEAIIARG